MLGDDGGGDFDSLSSCRGCCCPEDGGDVAALSSYVIDTSGKSTLDLVEKSLQHIYNNKSHIVKKPHNMSAICPVITLQHKHYGCMTNATPTEYTSKPTCQQTPLFAFRRPWGWMEVWRSHSREEYRSRL